MFSAVDDQLEFTVLSGVNIIANCVESTEGVLGTWRELVIHHLDWERAGFMPKGESQMDVSEENIFFCCASCLLQPKSLPRKKKGGSGFSGRPAHPGARELEAHPHGC